MKLTALRDRAETIRRHDGFVGHWRIIQWQPDLFVRQVFVVGVLVESSEGERGFRLMDKPERIECFYEPNSTRREFSLLMAMLRLHIAAQSDRPIPSPHLSFGEPCFVRGGSLQAMVDQLFAENVPAAKQRVDRVTAEEIGPSTEEARIALADFLKQMTNLTYEKIVRENGQTLSDHHLDVTLAPDDGAGSVISVCYRSAKTIEMKILRAAQDINAYAISQKRQHKAIFLLEPQDDILIGREREQIDYLIGNECWKLEQAGFITPRNTAISGMARDVCEWAMPLLSI